MRFITLLLLATSGLFAQSWSNVLTSSRAIDWTHAGLPASITYGSGGSACNGSLTNCVETITNPWTPPTRVQSGSTITCTNTSSDITTINSAIAAAKPGSYVLIAGACDTNGTNVVLRTNGVTLRGTSPQTATLTGASAFNIQFGVCCGTGSGPLSATSYASGTTSVTLTGANGNPSVGVPASLIQCDTGYSGSTCTGTYSDPGTIWVCGIDYPICSNNNTPSGTHQHQQQVVMVTGVTGTCSSSCVVTFTPGLYNPNWSSNNTATMTWQSQANWTYGNAIEDVTVKFPIQTTAHYDIEAAYGWWVKGNRVIGSPLNVDVYIGGPTLNGLFMNNYVFGEDPLYFQGPESEPITRANDTASLILNNIITGGNGIWGDGAEAGEVIAYNFSRDSTSVFYIDPIINHNPSESFILKEGNQFPQDHGDSTHGTNNLDTMFRSLLIGWDAPYWTQNPWSVELDNYNRFYNYIGNVLGGTRSTAYQGTSSSVGNIWVYPSSDTLAQYGSLRWGNYDNITGAVRWCGRTDPGFASAPCSSTSEIPDSTTLSSSSYPNATAYQNSTPASHGLPCSFYFTSSSSACAILPSGGTGFSWWKVCKTWTTFPTSCATSQTQPYPPIGPDQTGGPYLGGYAYDIPASIAYTDLPVDTSLQSSYAITASSWSNSTTTCASETNVGAAPCEMLTVTMSSSVNDGGIAHIMGGFNLSGLNSACLPSGLPANNEILMTGSIYVNSTTIKVIYSLGSSSPDNGSSNQCTGSGSGNLLFPNIREFDERVYENDPSSATVTITSPSSGQLIQTVGMTTLTATVNSPSVRSRLVWYMENIRLGTTFGTDAKLATIPATAACTESWDGPWTLPCNLSVFGDGPHTIYAKLFAEGVDISTGTPEATASITYTERVSGASTQSIASMPTSGASSPMEVQTFTNGTLGSSENSSVYVDGQILSQGCGANNISSWTSGYQVPTFFTTCFPNGTHWLTATYNVSGALSNSTILSQAVTFSGSTFSASASHYVTNGQPVAFSTTGTIQTNLIAGNEYVNTSGTGTPSYSISGSTMTILLPSSPSTTIVANTTQVRIWNTKVNNYIGQACDGYYTVSTVTSQTNFGITVPASCPSTISTASKGFDVIVNPFCGIYSGSNTTQFQVSACPSGSAITPSGGSGTLSVNVRPTSPEWGYTDLIEGGVQFFVQGQYTFSNGAVPMEMEPTIAEYHNTQGNSDTLVLNIKNTDLSLTASSCTASGVTCTAADIGPVTGAFSWNNSTQTMTYNSTGSWTNPSGYPTAWETLTISKTGVAQGAVVYYQNCGSSCTQTAAHFSHSGKILTTFTNLSSFFPLEVEGGSSPQNPAVWAGSHLQQSYFNSTYFNISANDNISNLAATSCSYSNQYGLAEAWAAQWGQNLSLDTQYLFVGDYNSGPRSSVFWGIMSNLGYNRQSCIQTTLIPHLVTAGVYWRLRIDDEWSDQMGVYLNSNVPISASGLFTAATVSGGNTITFTTKNLNLNGNIQAASPWSQSAGTGTAFPVTGATHFPNQVYLPSSVTSSSIVAPCVGCTNGTYTSTTDSGAAMVINPFTAQVFQNVSAWPNNAYADSVTWSGGTINLTSIVVSGSTATVNFSGAHGLTCTSPDDIVRIWGSVNGLNIVSSISSCAADSFVVTYPGGTGGTAPSAGTYTAAGGGGNIADAALYITVDDTVNAAFQSFWQTVVGGVSNAPAYCFSMLGSLFATSNAAGTQSYQFPTYATQPCSIGYIPQLDYKNIYGFDTSASGWGTYGNAESVITMRPWMAQPTSFYFAGSGASYQPYSPGMTFNPATDHPSQLNNRAEGPVQQYANMLISGAKALTLYSFYNTLVSSVEPGGGICSPSGCGLVANTNIGANYGIGPYVQPQQWNALTLLNSAVTQNQSLIEQPSCNHQYFGLFFGQLGVGCMTGSAGTIQIVDCQSESPYGSFPINTQAIAGGSVWLEFIDGYTRSLTLVAGNPSTITQEWCPAPGMWLIKALPSGSTLIDTMNFNPVLPSGATVAYVHVGYSPYDLYDTPGTLCTSGCSVPIQHNNSPAYYYVTYSSSTGPILSYNPQPIQIPSQGLP